MENESRQFPSADEIAEMATRDEEISKFSTNELTVVEPIPRVNVDLTPKVLHDRD